MDLFAYLIHILILIGIYGILTLSLNIAIGYTGLINLGHIAFFGIGAYTSALLTRAGLPFLLAWLAAGLLAMLAGYLLSWPSRRIKGDYFALLSLGFGFIVYSLFLNWQSITRGPLGIPGILRPSLLVDNYFYFVFVLVVTFLCFLFFKKLTNSPFGRVMGAVRDNEEATKVLGKNTAKVKMIVLMTSAFWAGLAGSLFAHYIRFIDPAAFYLPALIYLLMMVILGGIASLKGSIIAVAVVILLFETFRFVGLPPQLAGTLRQMLVMAILILILLFRPKGLFGRIDIE